MTELFDFGTRPIRVIENNNRFRFVHEKEGWIIAETFQAVTFLGDEAFDVYDGEAEFMGRVVSFGNLGALVSQIYDKEYGPDATPIKPDQIWVVFAKISDGTQEANFSREVNALNREGAEEAFLVQVHADQVLEPTEIITVYGPYMRA
jgi:hypothetical protein